MMVSVQKQNLTRKCYCKNKSL